MQIIIPMTGYGSRFVAAGYQVLKPLIKVQGRPMIEWIVRGMYTRDDHFLFVCRAEHLEENKGLREYLLSIGAHTEIFAVHDWIKKGPIFDVLRASDKISDTEPAIINYCDFYMTWDWLGFQREAKERACDGAIPCYTGFHPHLIPLKNVYASCQTDAADNLLEIREKHSFTKDKTKGKHSPGVYYFRSGALLKKYSQRLIECNIHINGEFYASLPYALMVGDGLTVWVPTNVKYFCQWGTPEDMAEYLFWTEAVRRFRT